MQLELLVSPSLKKGSHVCLEGWQISVVRVPISWSQLFVDNSHVFWDIVYRIRCVYETSLLDLLFAARRELICEKRYYQ